MDLKELKKTIKFLRAQGVSEYEDGGIKLKLLPIDSKPKASKSKTNVNVSDVVNSDPSMPTREELLFWSSDPSIQKQLEEQDAKN